MTSDVYLPSLGQLWVQVFSTLQVPVNVLFSAKHRLQHALGKLTDKYRKYSLALKTELGTEMYGRPAKPSSVQKSVCLRNIACSLISCDHSGQMCRAFGLMTLNGCDVSPACFSQTVSIAVSRHPDVPSA